MTSFDEYWDTVWNSLGEAAAAQAEHQLASDPAGRFVELISSAIASGRAHVTTTDGHKPTTSGWGWREDNFADRPQGRRIGWLDGDDLYLEPEAAIAIAKQLAEETGEPITVGTKTMHKRLREKAMLASSEDDRGTLTVRRTLEDRRRNVLHFHASLFEAEPAQPAQTTASPAHNLLQGQIDGADSVCPTAASAQETHPQGDDPPATGQIGRIPNPDDEIPF